MTADRPLLVHPGALGDLIRLTAVTEHLAWRWGAPCDLVVRHGAAALVFAGLPSVAEIRAMPGRHRPFPLDPAQWRLADWLRRRGGCAAYLVEERVHRLRPWRDETRMEWLLERAGYRPERRIVARHHPRGPLEHFVDYGLRLAALDPPACPAPGGAGPAPPPQPRLRVSRDELEDCDAWLQDRGLAAAPRVLFQAVSRRRRRGRWPEERWVALARQILDAEPEARILLLGTAAEGATSASLAAACADPRVVDVAGELPLRRLFALMTRSHSCVSLDTGPAHAAAALGCPLVVLTGRADPRRNRPRGPAAVEEVNAWPAERWPDSPHDWVAGHRLADIPLAAVWEAWRRLAEA